MEKKQPNRAGSVLGKFDPGLFYPSLVIYGCIIVFALSDPQRCGAFFNSIQNFVLSNFSWLILAVCAAGILFTVWMFFSSRFASVRLGGENCKPEFSFYAWVSMLFCAGLGTGFVIFGTAEPIYHLFTAPTIQDAGAAGTSRGVPEAIRLAAVNWGLLGWPLFCIGGWAIGYAAYRHGKPLRTSTGLYGIYGDRCNDTIVGKIVDILGIIATIGGVSMMIGLGVASITYAMKLLFGIDLKALGQFAVMLGLIVIYIASSACGIAKGMRRFSESTGYMALFLLVAVVFLGHTPITYSLNMLLQVTGEFIFRLPQNIFWTDAGQVQPRDWAGSWFIFYILWNISYVPFTSGFIARISKGRTMREFVFGTAIVPIIMCILWFSIWGSNACYEQLAGHLPIWSIVQDNPERALYMLLGSFPFGSVLCFIAFVCFCCFAITTADAASHFIAREVTPEDKNSGILMRVLWGCVIGMTGILFQITGGFASIKSLAISAGSVFVLIMLAYIVSIWKMMRGSTDSSENASPLPDAGTLKTVP